MELTRESKALVAADVGGWPVVLALVATPGAHAGRRFLEFFVVTIRNKNTGRPITTLSRGSSPGAIATPLGAT
jgi:hypothetical protein